MALEPSQAWPGLAWAGAGLGRPQIGPPEPYMGLYGPIQWLYKGSQGLYWAIWALGQAWARPGRAYLGPWGGLFEPYLRPILRAYLGYIHVYATETCSEALPAQALF